ncbi:substrate-binding domain-containing protein [Yeosuana sp. MJ-SS3]|uniref:Substrate-binding domain-containing protein n=1 Tax=Gilvirhabdus luticola TaxID=3079858 RepID=A0ABU3U9K5_9FLAO|nr:substrate-binding domain-containing protein [Yeosuana sp. MJ-SS3]MDU8887037.1 substrate-binding domain-containing protein [Yeosuana sp. MJ-SS3]
MTTIKIGGVPEHFNLAWYLTLKNGEYKKEGINLRWQDYAEGTGAMCKALRNNDIDLAVILTEGIIKDIVEGNPSKIVQTFVQSPLIWGIHVAQDSNYKTIEDIRGQKAAISRFGSGSHLMAYINAENHQWNIDKDLNFEIVNNLDGAVEVLTSGKADYFLWEKFTTKPLVDDHIFRRIGNCPTPWPCFVIAVTEKALNNNFKELKSILNIINNTTIEFKNIPSIDKTISNRYGQQLEDVQQWLSLTEWSQHNIDELTFSTIQQKLLEVKIIKSTLKYHDIFVNI